MIFYFTGTGNSFHVSKTIGEYCNERIISIPEEMKKNPEYLEYHLSKDEVIGFIYPIYAWAPPKMVLDFISKIRLYNYDNNYIFSIATCGENIGNAMELLQNTLKGKKLKLNSGFSIIMPNNYIILGNVDTKEVEEEKLTKAEKRLRDIGNIIREKSTGVFDVIKGPVPRFLTGVINPLFSNFGLNPKKFYATEDCTSCGFCQKICTSGNITVDKRPKWGSNCTQCLACIHRCPTKAIQYGKGTLKKGRYKNPNFI